MSGIPKRLRYEVLRRDNFTCRYCGASAPDVELTLDHVIPEVLGGATVASNLATACRPCNDGKASTTPDAAVVADVEQDAMRWSQAIRAMATIAAQQREERDHFVGRFDAAWQLWWTGSEQDPIPRDRNWPDSIARFRELGLTLEDLTDMLGRAMRAHGVGADSTWTYFCGMCWRTLRDRADIVAEYLRADP